MSMSDDDFEKLRRELVFEQVSKAIKENPKNWASKLEELGFQWVDDECDEEEVEENLAKPENLDQELLVAYFEGAAKLSEQVLDTYLAEKESATPNYPLIRKYFKRGNEHLRRLLIFGLERRPTDIGLLNDLGFFHEKKREWGNQSSYGLTSMRQELLDKLGRREDAFESAWSEFKKYPSVYGYEELMKYVGKQDFRQWHEKALPEAKEISLSAFIEICTKTKEWDILSERIVSVD